MISLHQRQIVHQIGVTTIVEIVRFGFLIYVSRSSPLKCKREERFDISTKSSSSLLRYNESPLDAFNALLISTTLTFQFPVASTLSLAFYSFHPSLKPKMEI